MKLRFTQRAAQGLHGIADYIRDRNPRAALSVRAAIVESLQTLVVFPRIGKRQKTESVRKLVTRRCPYLVYYTVDEESDEIVILTIQHPARERDYSDA
jgi:toxin ParE1/3/4